ncbi:MAG: phosphoglucosamine mutase [Oscillospiraceae bacterium]|jgi:phosphoglucosamine mutase|nr:phosphoglucosamine mutase [Oscillospiraceae bacterium]
MNKIFGTDGVRGVANKELTCELALAIAKSATKILVKTKNKKPKVLIGKDPRISCDMLEHAMASGFSSMGIDVGLLGIISTPGVAFLTRKYKAQIGVMISASHNSFEFNGIKLFKSDGYKLNDDLEKKIEEILFSKKDLDVANNRDIGKIFKEKNAQNDYVNYIVSCVNTDLNGLKVVLDCANGASYKTARKIFEALGAKISLLSCKPNGLNINENCGSLCLEKLRKAVIKIGADFGVAFDGDADRCLAVSNTGKIVDGDKIIAICALDAKEKLKLNCNLVAGTIMSNLGLKKFCEKNGIKFVTTKVGDRYVLEKMLKFGIDIGGEQSGHIIFRNYSTTGDGQLTAVKLAEILKLKNRKLEDLSSMVRVLPQKEFNIKANKEQKQKFLKNKKILSIISDAKTTLGENGKIVIRPSGTEPLIRLMVEWNDEKNIENFTFKIAEKISESL